MAWLFDLLSLYKKPVRYVPMELQKEKRLFQWLDSEKSNKWVNGSMGWRFRVWEGMKNKMTKKSFFSHLKKKRNPSISMGFTEKAEILHARISEK